jgi:hypothetical protein
MPSAIALAQISPDRWNWCQPSRGDHVTEICDQLLRNLSIMRRITHKDGRPSVLPRNVDRL